jgi:hypothetical protein
MALCFLHQRMPDALPYSTGHLPATERTPEPADTIGTRWDIEKLATDGLSPQQAARFDAAVLASELFGTPRPDLSDWIAGRSQGNGSTPPTSLAHNVDAHDLSGQQPVAGDADGPDDWDAGLNDGAWNAAMDD